LSEEDKKKVKDAFKKTGTIRGTRRLTGISRKAIRNLLNQSGLRRPNAPAAQKRKSKAPSHIEWVTGL
jgi:Zn-dependent membrane protease YugP